MKENKGLGVFPASLTAVDGVATSQPKTEVTPANAVSPYVSDEVAHLVNAARAYLWEDRRDATRAQLELYVDMFADSVPWTYTPDDSLPWTCVGCGADSPSRHRACDCPSSVLSARRDGEPPRYHVKRGRHPNLALLKAMEAQP
jgi:hypothetical protein